MNRSRIDGRRAGSLAACLLLLATASPAAACVGDCSGDGRVTVDEVVLGLDIGLGRRSTTACSRIDADEDGAVSISELTRAVASLLEGCPGTPTSTPTDTHTATPTDTPTATPTPTANLPPVLTAPFVYRTFPGFDVALPLFVEDPEGDMVTCTADALPDGAGIDPSSGEFRWTPSGKQLGPIYVPYTCADGAEPSASATGELTLKVQPPDPCGTPICDPATGCTVLLPPLDQTCCAAEPTVRVAEPQVDCPQGRIVFSGRNQRGFGRLQNCDQLRIINFNQTGAVLQYNIEGRCFKTEGVHRVTIRTRLETATRLAVNDVDALVYLDPDASGFDRFYALSLPIEGGGPFQKLGGAEANLTVTITDDDGATASNTTRVVLTFDALPDLPESQ